MSDYYIRCDSLQTAEVLTINSCSLDLFMKRKFASDAKALKNENNEVRFGEVIFHTYSHRELFCMEVSELALFWYLRKVVLAFVVCRNKQYSSGSEALNAFDETELILLYKSERFYCSPLSLSCPR